VYTVLEEASFLGTVIPSSCPASFYGVWCMVYL
jgi:hypothetical protein